MKYARLRAGIAVAVAAFVAVGTLAVAQAGPFGSGTLVGCVRDGSGQLRVIESAAECHQTESRIEWRSADALLDADTLDGLDADDLSLHCPEGLSRVEDICYTERRSDAVWVNALVSCANILMRLPTAAEQTRIFRAQVNLGLDEEYWTSDVTSATTSYAVGLTGNSFSDREAPRTEPIGYLCVESPQNAAAAAASLSARRADGEGLVTE